MNVQIAITGFSPVEDPAVLEALRAAVSQLAVAAEQVGYPLRVFVSPEDSGRFAPGAVITSLEPAGAVCGGPDLTLHVVGTGFTSSSSVILFKAASRAPARG